MAKIPLPNEIADDVAHSKPKFIPNSDDIWNRKDVYKS